LKGKKGDFDKLLMESIDEALTSLGNSAKQAIYFHLEDKFKVSKEEIPRRIEDFADGIEKIFGLGAHFIEILIMKKLHEKIGKPVEWDERKELVFVNYVKVAKESFEAKKKT
jgi:hypothetical protein